MRNENKPTSPQNHRKPGLRRLKGREGSPGTREDSWEPLAPPWVAFSLLWHSPNQFAHLAPKPVTEGKAWSCLLGSKSMSVMTPADPNQGQDNQASFLTLTQVSLFRGLREGSNDYSHFPGRESLSQSHTVGWYQRPPVQGSSPGRGSCVHSS